MAGVITFLWNPQKHVIHRNLKNVIHKNLGKHGDERDGKRTCSGHVYQGADLALVTRKLHLNHPTLIASYHIQKNPFGSEGNVSRLHVPCYWPVISADSEQLPPYYLTGIGIVVCEKNCLRPCVFFKVVVALLKKKPCWSAKLAQFSNVWSWDNHGATSNLGREWPRQLVWRATRHGGRELLVAFLARATNH